MPLTPHFGYQVEEKEEEDLICIIVDVYLLWSYTLYPFLKIIIYYHLFISQQSSICKLHKSTKKLLYLKYGQVLADLDFLLPNVIIEG